MLGGEHERHGKGRGGGGGQREHIRRILLPDLEGIHRQLKRGAHGHVAGGELGDGPVLRLN